MSRLTAFKKHEIKEMNKVLGGGITWKTQSQTGDDIYQTDAWYVLSRNNPTGDGHTDEFGDWHE